MRYDKNVKVVHPQKLDPCKKKILLRYFEENNLF